MQPDIISSPYFISTIVRIRQNSVHFLPGYLELKE